MAVNKNFVVKNGLEVDTNLILADATTNKVGIGTSVPQYPLHVFGGIGVTDSYVAGVSTIRNELNVGTGGTIFTVIATEAQDQFVGIRTANPAFLLDVRSPVSTGQTALYIQGDARITGNTNIEGDINIDEVNIRNLNVTGLSTFVGFVTYRESVAIQTNLYVGGISTFVGNINNIGGGATIGNIQIGITDDDRIDTRGNILVLDSAAGQVTVDDRLRVTGIGTFDTNVAIGGTLGVTGFSTFADSVMVQDNFQVGGISTFVGVSSFLSDVDVRGNFTLAGSVSLDTDLYIVGVATIGTLDVDGNANIDNNFIVTGITTLASAGGITTTGGDLYVGGDLFVKDDFVLDEATARNLNVTGITTVETLIINNNFDSYAGDSTFHGNVTIDGNVTIGGTSTIINAAQLRVEDKDIILGFTTSQDPTDDTANHGGIAIASTEGSPLVSLQVAGINTLPDTYKQIMWVKHNTMGAGTTDAWLNNYAVGIGSTLVPNGIRLAVGSIQLTDNTINSDQIIISGVTTLGGYVDINNNLDVSGTINIGGISTFVGFSTFKNDVYVAGVVTATAFHGDGSNLTGSASGLNAAIGIGSEGVFIGAGVTQLNFNTTTGTNVAVSAATAGIATVTITPGVSLGLAIALGG